LASTVPAIVSVPPEKVTLPVPLTAVAPVRLWVPVFLLEKQELPVDQPEHIYTLKLL